jgi:hypothetical protein
MLAQLDVSDNSMFGKKDKTGITAWAAALKACTSITALNLAKTGISAKDTKILAPAISNMGALSTLIFGGDTYNGKFLGGFKYEQITPEPATLEAGMTEVNFGNKNLGVGGAIIISAWLTNKDNGAMTSLNLALNSLGVEGAKIIAAFLPKCT